MEMLPKILALCGPASPVKTALAESLVNRQGFVRLPFDRIPKAMMEALGLTADELSGEKAQRPHGMLGGLSPARVLTLLKSGWGEEMVSADLWVHAWARAARTALEAGQRILVDDAETADQLMMVRALGGKLVHVEPAPEGMRASPHAFDDDSQEASANPDRPQVAAELVTLFSLEAQNRSVH